MDTIIQPTPALPLDDSQVAAIEAPADQPSLVLAGAGTGKTTLLTHRVAHLIHSGLAPETVCLLTFTNKAARHMLDRALQLIGPQRQRPAGGTFHHFGCRILREEAERLGLPGRFRILDGGKARALFKAAALRGESARASDGDYSSLLRKWNLARATCSPLHRLLHPADAADNNGTVACSFEEALPLIRAYEREKTRRGLVDYDDLLLKPVQLLEQHKDRRRAWQKRIRHLLIDEYQDTNPLQAYLVRLLAPRGNLTVVGDEAQCIYGWCGTPPSTLRDFTDHYPEAQIHRIGRNHRTTPQILALANALRRRHEGPDTLALHSTRPSGPLPETFTAPDPAAEAAAIVDRIQQLKFQEAYDYAAIAVLHRTRAGALPLAEALDRSGIPFRFDAPADEKPAHHSHPSSAVTLSTVHKAKGLEFPVVFLPGLQTGGFPHPKATSPLQQDEEARLFYVALTRAMDRLYLSACRNGHPSPGGFFGQLPQNLVTAAKGA